jgi:hypothetical protein
MTTVSASATTIWRRGEEEEEEGKGVGKEEEKVTPSRCGGIWGGWEEFSPLSLSGSWPPTSSFARVSVVCTTIFCCLFVYGLINYFTYQAQEVPPYNKCMIEARS